VIQNYTQGQTVQFQVDIYAHHNGFMEWFICDLDACGTDISTNCFADGYCQQLMRAPDAECDSGKDMYECLPIDLSYPGRWYLPCPLSENNLEMYYDKIYYKLPEKLVCEHCVIQWYWACDVHCTPPGVVDYFTGPNAPQMDDCPGGAGAVGGYGRRRTCGTEGVFPQEYWFVASICFLYIYSFQVSSGGVLG
jgi:Lytic polysaccharide mono-oxygenase, cellulose-degrading